MRKWLVLGGVAAAALIAVIFASQRSAEPQTTEPVPPPPSPAVDMAAVRAKAEQGDPQAQAQLGKLCENQAGPKGYAEAAKWFGLAAERGNADAQAGLAELYEIGQGVPKDPSKAIELYHLAAAQGHAGAQYALGFDYEAGRGVPQDHVEAVKWFSLAAEQGQPLAQYDLGQRYILGVGVPTNRVEALKWLILASAQGQPDAAKKKEELQKQLTRQEVAQAERLVEDFGRRRASSNAAVQPR